MVTNPQRAIYKHRWYGPTFGTNDLRIDRDGNLKTNQTSTDFGNDYFVPVNVNDRETILAGVSKFHPDEVEVFFV